MLPFVNNAIIHNMKSLPPEVKKFLSSGSLATIATISDDNDYPYVIPIYYILSDGFDLYFASHKDSKTLHNILSHSHVTFSITDPHNLIQVQLHGRAMVAEQKPEIIQKLLTVASEKSEDSFAPIIKVDAGVMQLITFVINWYKLSNYSGKEPVFIEDTLEDQS